MSRSSRTNVHGVGNQAKTLSRLGQSGMQTVYWECRKVAGQADLRHLKGQTGKQTIY